MSVARPNFFDRAGKPIVSSPLSFKSEQVKAQKYLDIVPDGVFSIGRPGSYRFNVDIDDTVAPAMGVADKLQS